MVVVSKNAFELPPLPLTEDSSTRSLSRESLQFAPAHLDSVTMSVVSLEVLRTFTGDSV